MKITWQIRLHHAFDKFGGYITPCMFLMLFSVIFPYNAIIMGLELGALLVCLIWAYCTACVQPKEIEPLPATPTAAKPERKITL